MLAQGDILVNLDCDNYTGENGRDFMLENMEKYGVDSTIIHQFSQNFGEGSYGRITVSRQDFLKIGGYDESFEPMTYQDDDLLISLRLMGLKHILLSDRKYNRAISNTK